MKKIFIFFVLLFTLITSSNACGGCSCHCGCSDGGDSAGDSSGDYETTVNLPAGDNYVQGVTNPDLSGLGTDSINIDSVDTSSSSSSTSFTQSSNSIGSTSFTQSSTNIHTGQSKVEIPEILIVDIIDYIFKKAQGGLNTTNQGGLNSTNIKYNRNIINNNNNNNNNITTTNNSNNINGGSITFAYVGDGRDLHQSAKNVGRLVKGLNPDLVIAGGDMWDPKHGHTIDDPKTIYGSFISKDPRKNRFWNALGNHEWSGIDAAKESAKIVPLPRPGYESYTIVKGNVRFFFIDWNDRYNKTKVGNLIKKYINHPRKKWNILVIHRPIYATSQRGDEPKLEYLNDYPIDLYLTSHDHVYLRFIYNGKTYIVNGIGGAGTRGSASVRKKRSAAGTPKKAIGEGYGALFCNVNISAITCNLKMTDGRIRDNFTITK